MIRLAIAIAAVVGLATPASAVVDLDVKRAIVEVVLENLGVDASAEFILGIAQELDTAELDAGLVTAVTNLLDAGTDPRSVIESQTDANGDGIPDEGSALDSPDDSAGDDEGDDSGSNSGTGSNNSDDGEAEPDDEGESEGESDEDGESEDEGEDDD
jgi:cobalamin biosynthesis protein CobT